MVENLPLFHLRIPMNGVPATGSHPFPPTCFPKPYIYRQVDPITQKKAPKRLWRVYIVACADRTLYTGITNDLHRRLAEHNHGPLGAKYTRSRRPVRLVYCEEAPDRSTAAKREYFIKNLTLADKTTLIETAGAIMNENSACPGEK